MAERDPMVSFVVGEFERYDNFHRDRFSKAEEIYKMWAVEPPTRSYTWQNRIRVPITFEAEQTITPRIFSALFPTDAPIDMLIEDDSPVEQGIRIKSLIQRDFRIANVQANFYPSVSDSVLFGTGYGEVFWQVLKGWMIFENGERRYVITAMRNACEHVSFFEMYPHPNKMYMEDGLPLIRRRFCDADYLRSLAENPFFKFTNLDKALQTKSPVSKPSMIQGADGKSIMKPQDDYELLEYWGPYDEAQQKDSKIRVPKGIPHWIIVVNREVKARGIPNPYNHQSPPFFKIKLFNDSKSRWFGKGVGEVGYPTQERLDKIVNQRLDNVELVLNKQGCYNGADPLVNIKKLEESKPGRWHKVSDTVTSLRWIDTPDVTASSYEEEKIAKMDYRESTGAVSALMPAEDSKQQHRAAIGIQLLQGAAGIRYKPILALMELSGIQRIAQLFIENARQFMTTPQWAHLTGSQGTKPPIIVTPQELRARIRFVPTGISETANKEIQVAQLLRFKELSRDDPTVNRTEINRRIAELFGFKDIDKLLIQQEQTVGSLTPAMQAQIRQRLAEGADPEQIKAELLGPRSVERSMPGANPAETVPIAEGVL